MAHASTWEAETGGSLSSRLAWSIERAPGQPGLQATLELVGRGWRVQAMFIFLSLHCSSEATC